MSEYESGVPVIEKNRAMTLIRSVKTGLSLLLVCSVGVSASDRKSFGNIQVQEVVSIYDADTFRVNIDGWPDLIGRNMPIRADGFDAPEIRGKCQAEKDGAQRARDLTVKALQGAEVIELRNMRRGKYFRIIADVYVDGESLKDLHFSAGTARSYAGGNREGWCSL